MKKVLFTINKADESGYNALAEGESIFIQASTLEEVDLNIVNAIRCHFHRDHLPEFVLNFV